LVEKSEGNRLLERPRHREKYNIKIDNRRNNIGECGLHLSGSG
jgi:hypothetical protein